MNRIDIEAVDLNLFKVFEALYQERSATRAALRLGLTQSAVSAALGRLRVLLADPLFVRTGRGLAPSSRASELFPLLTEALDKCRQSLDLFAVDAGSFAGRSVVVGLSDDFEVAIGQRLVDAVDRQAPGLRLVFRQTHSRVVADMLLAREFDLAVTSGGLSVGPLSREAFGQGAYACVMDPASVDAAQSALTVADFLARRHILVSSGGIVGLVDEILAISRLERLIMSSTTHFSALPFLLKGTSAIATVPRHAARALAACCGLALRPCPIDMPGYPVELGWRADSLRNPAVARVKALAAGVLGGFDWLASGPGGLDDAAPP